MTGYAVVDVETTGIHPGRYERIVEVAVVHVSARGAITGTWETLVNPERDLGPQRIHGIRAAEILRAPTFEQIADEFAALLRGRVVVAHNLRFDAGFLAAEYLRCGHQVPIAAAELLIGYLALDPGALHWSDAIMRAASLLWPLMASSGTAWLPREQARQRAAFPHPACRATS